MTSQDHDYLPPELLAKITDVVSGVILQQTGRMVRPKPDESIVDKRYLDEIQLMSLALALQTHFDVELHSSEITPLSMQSVASIGRLLRGRVVE